LRIVAHKSMKYDYSTFLRENINNPRIVGISFDILMTKDKRIIIYTPYGNYISAIDMIQSNTYDNLTNTDIIPLEDALRQISSNNKKVILNLLPIVSPPTDENELINISRLNEEYVNTVNQVIAKFSNLNFYICSAYDNLVFQIRRLKRNYKAGFIVSNLSSNYIDVDFYAFTTNMIDRNIIYQQLNLNKEVMLYILNCDDMDQAIKTFYQEQPYSSTAQNAFQQIYFINNYPDVFWRLFN